MTLSTIRRGSQTVRSGLIDSPRTEWVTRGPGDPTWFDQIQHKSTRKLQR